MSKPILYIFTISHYCEKARWALDYLEIDYQLEHVAPGFHVALTRKLGVDSTTLPLLLSEEGPIQGSAAIIDWADQHTSSNKRLTPSENVEECLEIEKRLDDVGGVHTRRCFYSEAMVEYPALVKPVFVSHLSTFQRVVVSLGWGMIGRSMIRSMDLGRAQGEESAEILEVELDWLDGLLADGRPFLAGNSFTRADVAAASLFSRLASPPEHPGFEYMFLPPRMAKHQARWRNRPIFDWIRGVYRKFR